MSADKVIQAPADDGSKSKKVVSSAPVDAAEANLDLLEEDDEFEEFPAETWTGVDEDTEDVQLWGDNWSAQEKTHRGDRESLSRSLLCCSTLIRCLLLCDVSSLSQG